MMDILEKLVKAQERIQALEQQNAELERERDALNERLAGPEGKVLVFCTTDVRKLVEAARRVDAALQDIRYGECACIKDLPGDNSTCDSHRLLNNNPLAEALKPFLPVPEQEKR